MGVDRAKDWADRKKKNHAEYLKWDKRDDMGMLARSQVGKSGSPSDPFG